MKLVYEDDIQVVHESEKGSRVTSLKKCPHGINIWNHGWDKSLCNDCNQPERLNPEEVVKDTKDYEELKEILESNPIKLHNLYDSPTPDNK